MSIVKEKELKLFEKAASEFAKKQLAPNREENDNYPYGPFFESVVQKAFEVDFFHITLPEALGGMDQGMHALSVVLTNICSEDCSLGGIIFTNAAAQQLLLLADCAGKLEQIATAETVNDFLIGWPVFNNPSEITPRVHAKKVNEGYTLHGTLEYMVLGGIAGHGLVPAAIDDQDDQKAYSFFLVNLSQNGIVKSDPVLSLGLHACPAVDMTFDATPAELIGNAGKGAVYFNQLADRFQVAAAAMSVGIVQGAFKEAFDYSRKRFQGGQAIINWSEVKMMLADMAVKLKNAEMILTTATHAVDDQTPGWPAASRAAALHIQEMACDLTSDGIQVLGGVGYMKDFGQEKRFRDAKHIQALLGIAPLKKIKYIETLMV